MVLNPFGISNETEKREIKYNTNMSCAQSTIIEVREKAKDLYKDMNLILEKEEQVQRIEVRRATEELQPLIEKHTGKNLVIKMNCEGEEYNIIRDLVETRLLQEFSFIMCEWHYRGKEKLLEDFVEAGFSYWCVDKASNMGWIYAYKEDEK